MFSPEPSRVHRSKGRVEVPADDCHGGVRVRELRAELSCLPLPHIGTVEDRLNVTLARLEVRRNHRDGRRVAGYASFDGGPASPTPPVSAALVCEGDLFEVIL